MYRDGGLIVPPTHGFCRYGSEAFWLQKETRHVPKNRESISRKSFYFVEERALVIKVMTQATVAALIGFVNRGDGGEFWEEGRAFVGGDVSIWLVR